MVRTLRGTSGLVLLLIFLALSVKVSTASAANWWESVALKGDFRFRHEMIDEEGKDARNRQRIRARLAVQGDVAPGIGVVIQLATGSSDPVSANQTLGDAGSTKSIGLDLAYAKATHKKLPGITLMAGKMKNPLHEPGGTELIWDGDWNPEGGALQIEHSSKVVSFEATGGAFWLVERSSTDDSWLGAIQGLATAKFDEGKSTATVGGSYFDFVNTRYYPPFYDASNGMGNTVISVEESNGATSVYYANKYQLVEFFAEASHKFESTPVGVFFDFVTNTSADSLDTGWLLGLSAGRLKKPGDWQVNYTYRKVEKDAVVGAFTDSDFRGGGTDGKGHEFGGAVQVAEHTALHATFFLNKRGLQGAGTDYSRLQVDAQLKF